MNTVSTTAMITRSRASYVSALDRVALLSPKSPQTGVQIKLRHLQPPYLGMPGVRDIWPHGFKFAGPWGPYGSPGPDLIVRRPARFPQPEVFACVCITRMCTVDSAPSPALCTTLVSRGQTLCRSSVETRTNQPSPRRFDPSATPPAGLKPREGSPSVEDGLPSRFLHLSLI